MFHSVQAGCGMACCRSCCCCISRTSSARRQSLIVDWIPSDSMICLEQRVLRCGSDGHLVRQLSPEGNCEPCWLTIHQKGSAVGEIHQGFGPAHIAVGPIHSSNQKLLRLSGSQTQPVRSRSQSPLKSSVSGSAVQDHGQSARPSSAEAPTVPVLP